MPINHKDKIIFVHIPKTGGTSIAEVLNMFPKTGSHVKSLPHLYGIDSNGLVLQSMPFCYYERYCSPEILKSYKKFTVVRNPYSRSVSEHNMFRDYRFSDKSLLNKLKNIEARISKGEKQLKDQCTNLRQIVFLDYLKLVEKTLKQYDKETISKYNQKGMPTHHNHFLPQYEHIKSDKYKIDYVLKQENLQEDFKAISSKNVPKKNIGKSVKWQEYYTQEHIDIINRIYHVDFEEFNYKKM
jgi:hypothetical protein